MEDFSDPDTHSSHTLGLQTSTSMVSPLRSSPRFLPEWEELHTTQSFLKVHINLSILAGPLCTCQVQLAGILSVCGHVTFLKCEQTSTMPQVPKAEKPLLSRSDIRPALSASHVGGGGAGRRAGSGVRTWESKSKCPVAQKGGLPGPQSILCPWVTTLEKLGTACMEDVEAPDLSP